MSVHFAYPGLFLFAFEKALFDQCPFECPILLLVRHFDLADRIEKVGDRFMALLFGDRGESGAHLFMFVALPDGGVLQVFPRRVELDPVYIRP